MLIHQAVSKHIITSDFTMNYVRLTPYVYVNKMMEKILVITVLEMD